MKITAKHIMQYYCVCENTAKSYLRAIKDIVGKERITLLDWANADGLNYEVLCKFFHFSPIN